MNKLLRRVFVCAMLALVLTCTLAAGAALAEEVAAPAAAADDATGLKAIAAAADDATGLKAIAAAATIALASVAGAISMGVSISKASESISRQPEAAGSIRTSLMLGLVFIETAIIYALIVAILIVFVL